MTVDRLSAAEIARAVTGRKLSALDATEAALARIAKHNPILNAFTDVTADRARTKARAIDVAIAAAREVIAAQIDERGGSALLDEAIVALPQRLR